MRSPGNCKRPPARQVTYWPGDVVCAKIRNAHPPTKPFYFDFSAEDNIQFSQNTGWKTYKPKNRSNYWLFTPTEKHPNCVKSRGGIWGAGNPAYIYHRITARDLLPNP